VTLLRAIPFSLAILWRLAMVFPFLIVGLALFGIAAGVLMVVLAIVSPVLTFLLVLSFGVAASVLPMMVGARLGLQARGASTRNSYVGLVLPAIGYGLFEAFCVLLIIAGAAAVYLFATPLTLQDLMQIDGMTQADLAKTLMSVSPAITLSLLWVGGVLVVGLRAALLMPFAGASVGADPSGRAHTPFYGFGSEFLSMLILVVISYVLWAFAVPIAFAISELLGYGETLAAALTQLQMTRGTDVLALLGLETAVFIGVTLLLYLWAFSLQCAGGALLYLNQVEQVSDEQNAFDMSMDAHLGAAPTPTPTARPERQIQSSDVMDLIRKRMQENKR